MKREELLAETRVDLVRRAKKLRVPGYSRMTKDELIRAIVAQRKKLNTARRALGQPG